SRGEWLSSIITHTDTSKQGRQSPMELCQDQQQSHSPPPLALTFYHPPPQLTPPPPNTHTHTPAVRTDDALCGGFCGWLFFFFFCLIFFFFSLSLSHFLPPSLSLVV